jgi:hypothetical protein
MEVIQSVSLTHTHLGMWLVELVLWEKQAKWILAVLFLAGIKIISQVNPTTERK